MTTTIVTPNAVDSTHLEEVIAEMRLLGAPTIRVVRDDLHNMLVALEGTHRLAACKALGITPVLDILTEDTPVTCDSIGWADPQNLDSYYEARDPTAGELMEAMRGAYTPYVGGMFFDFDI